MEYFVYLLNEVAFGKYLLLIGIISCILQKEFKKQRNILKNFKAIKCGMTYSDVSNLLGSPGEIISERKYANNSIQSQYIWYFGWYKKEINTGRIMGYKSSNIDYGNTKGLFNNVNKERSYIKIEFLNEQVVCKGQKGIDILES